MAPIARDSWTLSSSVFTVHEDYAPCPPVIFESPIRSRAFNTPTVSGEDFADGSHPRTVSVKPLRLEERFDVPLDESSEPSAEVNIDENSNQIVERGRSSCGKPRRKPQTARAKLSNKTKKSKRTLSAFDELMLKLNAVDGPQLVLELTKLEDMSPAEVEANWRAC